jgi:nucleoside-diphosphate-sugar epimerase
LSVLVTGFGTVGVAVAISFADAGYDVTVFDSSPNKNRVKIILGDIPEEKIKIVPGDIRDLSRLIDVMRKNSIEGIVHTAALTLRSSPLTYPKAIFSVNTIGTFNILEAVRILDLEKVIYTSSGAIFGDLSPTRIKPIKEEEPVSLTSRKSLYDVSKYSSELILSAYNRIYNIDSVTCRIQWVYGIGEKNPRDIGKYLYTVLKGDFLTEESGGDITADYSYNMDVAEGIRLIYTTRKNISRIYNLSSGQIWKLGKVVDMINKMGPGKIEIGPGVGGRFSYLKDSIRSAPFDIAKAKKLGYNPRSMKEALKDYSDWIKNKGSKITQIY